MRPSLFCRRRRARPRVVFPDPLSPTTPTVWPSRTVTSMPSTAFTQPVVHRSKPDLIGNQTLTSSADMTTGASAGGGVGAPFRFGGGGVRGDACLGRDKGVVLGPGFSRFPLVNLTTRLDLLPAPAQVLGDGA